MTRFLIYLPPESIMPVCGILPICDPAWWRHKEAPAERHRNRQCTLERIQATKTTHGLKITLTRDFKDAIKDRVARDPAFRGELLKEGIECLLTGDVDTGKAVLRDFINATIIIPLHIIWKRIKRRGEDI